MACVSVSAAASSSCLLQIDFFSITARGMESIFGVDIKCPHQIHV